MSKKCEAFSRSKIGLEPADNRKAFYAGWDSALAHRDAQAAQVNQQLLWAAKNVINNDGADGSKCYNAVKLYEARNQLKAAISAAEALKGGA